MLAYQYLAETLFFAFVILAVLGAVLSVRAKILMHGVLGLAVCLLGVGGLYFYLGSLFLTMMQILIYVGAICILLVFGIMVGYTPNQIAEQNLKGKNRLLALAAGGLGLGILVYAAVVRTQWEPASDRIIDFSLQHLGNRLLYQYCLAFELISVVLLAAIVGAIILATIKAGEGENAE